MYLLMCFFFVDYFLTVNLGPTVSIFTLNANLIVCALDTTAHSRILCPEQFSQVGNSWIEIAEVSAACVYSSSIRSIFRTPSSRASATRDDGASMQVLL